MLGAGAHFSSWLDLATLTDMAAKTGQILVVHVLDVVDRKRRNLATWRVAPAAAWPSSTGARSTAVTAIAFATAGSAALPLWPAKARSAGSAVAVGTRRSIVSFLGAVRHG